MSDNSKTFQDVSIHSTNVAENYLKIVSSQKVATPQSDVLPTTIRKALTKTLNDNKEGFDLLAQ
ncbi:MAG TPA: hypothetical protein O0X50_02325 [Methanocorpusculum sp.]|nr:hypothetical protein [Methanocorpusculum sp.]